LWQDMQVGHGCSSTIKLPSSYSYSHVHLVGREMQVGPGCSRTLPTSTSTSATHTDLLIGEAVLRFTTAFTEQHARCCRMLTTG
jgi:hypothetical protein